MDDKTIWVGRFTTAPEDYDGFCTETVQQVGETKRGKPIRLVRIDGNALDWQSNRYFSGLHGCWNFKEWTEMVEFKLATPAELSDEAKELLS